MFSGFNVKVEQAIKQNDIKKFKFYVFLPEIILTSLYAVVAFLSTYALQNVLSKFVNSFPEFVSHGFEIAGGLLPGLGLALLLKVMVKKENVPYFVTSAPQIQALMINFSIFISFIHKRIIRLRLL